MLSCGVLGAVGRGQFACERVAHNSVCQLDHLLRSAVSVRHTSEVTGVMLR